MGTRTAGHDLHWRQLLLINPPIQGCRPELRTTDLAALREVDVSAPFRLPVIFDAHWKGISTTPTKHGPQRLQNAWYDAATAHWAAIKGLIRAKHPTKQRLNSFWFRMYCHGTSKDPDPSTLRAAVTSFPFQYKDEGVVQYRQILMWLAAQTSMIKYMGMPKMQSFLKV